MHTQIKQFSSKSTRFNPYFGSNNYRQHNLAKVRIKSCRFAKERVSFVYVYKDVTTQVELCLHEQTQIVANAACRVGSQLLVTLLSYCDP